jgi:hypothetical protein
MPPYTVVEIIRNGLISVPYPGKELIWDVVPIGNGSSSHALHCVLELNKRIGVFAIVDVQGSGPYHFMEETWKTLINSFLWDPDRGAFLKFDGDEAEHRDRHKKTTTRTMASAQPRLPTSLKYLMPVVQELLSLPPEEIHEDVALPDVGRILRLRTQGRSHIEANALLKKDYNALEKWMNEDYDRRNAVEFLLGILESSVAMDINESS